MGGGIPEGWHDYTSIGKKIPGTKFIAFKVPLKEETCCQLPIEQRFTPRMLLKELPQLYLVVDLTATAKYYNPSEVTSRKVRHEKIYVQGRMVPPERQVHQFIEAVDNAWDKAKDGLIGVHCTHGVNRTGYFICRYMVDRLGFTPEDARKAFELARGHEMIREYLIDAIVPSNVRAGSKEAQPGSRKRARRDSEDSSALRHDSKRPRPGLLPAPPPPAPSPLAGLYGGGGGGGHPAGGYGHARYQDWRSHHGGGYQQRGPGGGGDRQRGHRAPHHRGDTKQGSSRGRDDWFPPRDGPGDGVGRNSTRRRPQR